MFAWRNRPKGKGDMGRDPTSVLARSPWDFRNDASRIEVVGWDYTQLKPIDWNPFQPKESDFNWRGCPTIINFSSRPTDFEPPRKTTRGLRVTLPFITKMSPSDELLREANLAFLYCYREPKGEMVCLVLHENDGINSSGAKGQYYRPLGGQGIHFVAPQSVTVEFRTVYIRITSREQPLRLRLKALGFEGLAAIVLLDAKGTPKLLKQKPTDKKLFLLHVKCGEVFVRVLVSMGHEKRWCCMSTTPDKTFNIKKERASKEIAALMIDDRAGFSERMSTSTILPAGKFECTLKARPHGWLELPSNADLQQGTTGLEKVYSLGLRYGSSQRERLPVEIVESMWYDKK